MGRCGVVWYSLIDKGAIMSHLIKAAKRHIEHNRDAHVRRIYTASISNGTPFAEAYNRAHRAVYGSKIKSTWQECKEMIVVFVLALIAMA